MTFGVHGKEYIPDISVSPKRKVDRLHDIVKMTALPLLAIEIISPNQGTLELMNQFDVYFEGDIKSCWLVDPLPGSVMVLNSPDKLFSLIHDNTANPDSDNNFEPDDTD